MINFSIPALGAAMGHSAGLDFEVPAGDYRLELVELLLRDCSNDDGWVFALPEAGQELQRAPGYRLALKVERDDASRVGAVETMAEITFAFHKIRIIQG